MNFLLDKMSFCQLLSYLKGGFMPCLSPKLYKSPCSCGTPPLMKLLISEKVELSAAFVKSANNKNIGGK